jgi:hypothetical protein
MRLVDDVLMLRFASVRQVRLFAALVGIAAVCIAATFLLHAHPEHHTNSATPPTTPGQPLNPIPVYLRGAIVTSGQVSPQAGQRMLPYLGDDSRVYQVSKTPIAALSASYAWVQQAGSRFTWEIQLYAPGFTNATTKGQPFVTTLHGHGIEGMPVYGSGLGGPNVAFDGVGSEAAAVKIARSWTSQVTVFN